MMSARYIFFVLTLFFLSLSPGSASSLWRSVDGDTFRFEKRGVVDCSYSNGRKRTGKWKWDQRHNKIQYYFRGESKAYYVFIQGKSASVYFGGRDLTPTKWTFVESRGAESGENLEGWFMAVPAVPSPTY